MRIVLKRKDRSAGTIEVKPDGALVIEFDGKTLPLSAKISRRIAGEVLRVSVEHTRGVLEGRMGKAAAALFGSGDDE